MAYYDTLRYVWQKVGIISYVEESVMCKGEFLPDLTASFHL